MSESLLARTAFHQPHLLRVSRSFAYGIGRLETPLRAKVGLGYLLCRILDTVEDAPWPVPLKQLEAFEKFDSFLTSRPMPESVSSWRHTFPTAIPEGEELLLNDAAQVFSEFHSLSELEKSVMRKPILSMSAGMKFFTQRTREVGVLKLNSLTEMNAYCLFVAGVVGELLTGLVNIELKREGLSELPRRDHLNGCHFGLFLQKINILKDQWVDEREGRFFVPNRVETLESVRMHADRALEYLLSIPLVKVDYRLFCAWALYLGLATMPLLEIASPNDVEPTKLSRTRALFLGGKIELAIDDEKKLKDLFHALVAESSVLSKSAAEPMKHKNSDREQIVERVFALYDGELSKTELVQALVPSR